MAAPIVLMVARIFARVFSEAVAKPDLYALIFDSFIPACLAKAEIFIQSK